MKKIILMSVLAFVFAACGGDDEPSNLDGGNMDAKLDTKVDANVRPDPSPACDSTRGGADAVVDAVECLGSRICYCETIDCENENISPYVNASDAKKECFKKVSEKYPEESTQAGDCIKKEWKPVDECVQEINDCSLVKLMKCYKGENGEREAKIKGCLDPLSEEAKAEFKACFEGA